MFKEKIVKYISKESGMKREEVLALLERPNPEFGDYAFPCFALALRFKKSPIEIAKELEYKIVKLFDDIEVKAVGPYVNFKIKGEILAKNIVSEILKKRDNYGKNKKEKEIVMVEFSQANTHKAFHVGHIRGTVLGESIARILEFLGKQVLRVNYQGDTGMHVAKWIWCYQKYHQNEKLKKDESWVASIYVEAVKKLQENEKFQEEVNEINRKLESREDKNLNELWKKTRKISLDAYEKIYRELNTRFDEYFFESQFEKRGKEITQELLNKKIAMISDGAVIVDLKKYNLGVWVLLRKDGTVLYSAKDLALAEEKFKRFKIDKSIYVVGSEQKLHFYQLFKTLELMGFKKAEKCKYIPVSLVRKPEGKMSSRTGDNILYSNFKKEVVDYAKKEIMERYPHLNEKEVEERAAAIAIAAIKYNFLKQDLNKIIIFVKEDALKFEGDTGPYLLYSYARASSIIKKSKKKKFKLDFKNITWQENLLVRKLGDFSEIILKAGHNLEPNIIANYAYELAKDFTSFYQNCQVCGSDQECCRLALVESFRIVMKNALWLLGIDVIEEM